MGARMSLRFLVQAWFEKLLLSHRQRIASKDATRSKEGPTVANPVGVVEYWQLTCTKNLWEQGTRARYKNPRAISSMSKQKTHLRSPRLGDEGKKSGERSKCGNGVQLTVC